MKAKTQKPTKTKDERHRQQSKLSKLELAFASKQISKADYDMWRIVYSKEEPFEEVQPEEVYIRRNKKRK